MKLKITQVSGLDEPEVDIRYTEMDPQLRKAIELLQEDTKAVTVRQENSTRRIRSDEILYFESVDDKTFVYDSSEVYSCDMKLYELEKMFCEHSFVRISKSCILNIDHLDSVRVLMNGKMEVTLQNGEKLVVNRHYVPSFKKKFGL